MDEVAPGTAGVPLFAAEGMRCVVPSPHGDRVLFEGLAFAVRSGQIVDLVGPSGSGKSSLLTAFARLNPHASGRMTLDGRDCAGFTPQRWRRAVAYLPQKPVLPGATVADAIRLPFTLAVRAGSGGEGMADVASPTRHGLLRSLRDVFRGNDARARDLLTDARIRATLDAMGCADIDLDRPPHDLSGGQAARVSLARTLLTSPRVLLADEVDAGLDDDNAAKVASIMADAAARGMAIVRIRHRPPDGRASRIAALEDGKLRWTDAAATDAPMGDGATREAVA